MREGEFAKQEKAEQMEEANNNIDAGKMIEANEDSVISSLADIPKHRLYTLILLTTLFPFVGAICASLGLERIRNVKELKRAEKRKEKTKEQQTKIKDKISDLEGRIKGLESYLSWCGYDVEFVKNQTAFFYSCYLKGHEKGVMSKVPVNLYEYAKLKRSRELLLNGLSKV